MRSDVFTALLPWLILKGLHLPQWEYLPRAWKASLEAIPTRMTATMWCNIAEERTTVSDALKLTLTSWTLTGSIEIPGEPLYKWNCHLQTCSDQSTRILRHIALPLVLWLAKILSDCSSARIIWWSSKWHNELYKASVNLRSYRVLTHFTSVGPSFVRSVNTEYIQDMGWSSLEEMDR